MNEDKTEQEINPEEKQAGTEKRKTSGTGLTLLAFIIAVVAAVMAIYNYRNMAEDTAVDPSILERIDGLQTSLLQLNQSVDAIQSRQQAMRAGLEESRDEVNDMRQSLQSLYNQRSDNDQIWSIKVAEHLISIASHRVVLEQDVETALAALQQADDILANNGDPDLFQVRQALASEMNALRSVSPVDITGISLYLTDMVTRIETLPLRAGAVAEITDAGQAHDPGQPAWKRLLLDVWYEFKSMFTIIRTGAKSSATLLPDEKYFLYQNLRMQLEAARLAVLRRDTGNLQESLVIAESWLEEYFDTANTAVTNVLQSLVKMHGLVLDPVLPAPGNSLQLLRGYLGNNQNNEPAMESSKQ